MYWNGYRIEISDKPLKKYYAIVDGKRVYFGDTRYQQYYDILGTYSFKNHLDKDRRTAYYKRHGLSAKKGTPKYFSHKIL